MLQRTLSALSLVALCCGPLGCSEPVPEPMTPAAVDQSVDRWAPPLPPIDDGPMPKDDDPIVTGLFDDLPASPRVEPGLPPDIAAQFVAPSPSEVPQGQPCLTEPPIDALFPKNWTPPLFEWGADSRMDVFELRVHIANQSRDLVIYTARHWFSLDADIWQNLAQHSAGYNMSVTLRGASLSGGALASAPVLGSAGDVHIAPAVAPGTVVFWTTSGTSALKAFQIGDVRVQTVITPDLLQDGSHCVGCHAPSPDGKLLFMSRNGVPDSPFGIAARLSDGSGGAAPTGSVSTVAQALLGRSNQTLPAFSPAHYSPTDAVVLTALNDASTAGRFEITWTDLHAAAVGPDASGVLRRDGDLGQAATPAFSSDGQTVAYTSSAGVTDGRPRSLPTDIYTVPFAGRAGGLATPLPGASDPAYSEYYPTFSPSDRFIAFDRVVAGTNTYHEPSAEIFVVSAGGGTPVRIAGNRPAACSGKTSPGLTNSWPRWAPTATLVRSKRYYWIVFSSTRRSAEPQIFIAAVVTEISEAGERLWKTYPAVYLSSQDIFEGNHTPTWSDYSMK